MNGADPGPSPRAEDEAIAMAEPDGAGAATVVLRDTPRPGGDAPPAPRMWCGPARLWLLGAAWFTWLCGYAYVTLESHIRTFSDTEAMRNMADQPLRFPDLFFQIKPPLYPLAMRFAGDDLRLLVVGQTAFYFAAWGTLLWIVVTRPRGFAVAAALALATVNFALYPEFAGWNHVVLSETLALSLTVLAGSCLWLAAERRRPAMVVAWLVVLTVSTTARDFTGYYGLALLPALVCLRGLGRVGTLATAGCVLVLGANFSLAFYTGDHTGKPPLGGRWVFEMLNNVGQRILPSPELRAFFVDQGMPMNEALERRTGKWAHDDDLAFYHDPELEDFRHWVHDHSKRAYAAALLAHPGYTFHSLVERKEDVLQWNVYVLGFYPDANYLRRSLFRIEHKWIHAGNLVALGILFALAWRRRSKEAWWLAALCACFYACLWPLAFFTFHADAMEVARHCVPISLQNVLALLLTSLALVRVLQTAREEREPREAAPS